MKQIKYSFVFPVFNEEKYLEIQIKNFFKIIKKLRINSYEVLIVENGSLDKSWYVIKKNFSRNKNIRTLRINNPSYGRAIKHGLLSSFGKYVFILNLDYFDIHFIAESMSKINKYDIVVGSKNLLESDDKRSIYRRAQTYVFNQIIKYIFKYPGTDTHGVKVFKNNLDLKITANQCISKHELFDTELLIRLIRNKHKYIEIPTEVKEIRQSRYFPFRRQKLVFIDLIKLISVSFFKKKKIDLFVADDYGLNKIVDVAIIDQMKSSAIDAVSILPNFVEKESLYKLKKHKDKVLFGAHLNLVRGESLLPRDQISSLIDNNGCFFSTPLFLIKLFLGIIKSEEIKSEILAQINFLEESDVFLDYVDSEQHIHTLFIIKEIVSNVIENKNLLENKKIKIRSDKSTVEYLKKKPIRYCFYMVINLILNLRFGSTKSQNNRLDMAISHPGSDYD